MKQLISAFAATLTLAAPALAQTYAITNGQVVTNTDSGILESATVLVRDGDIVGRKLPREPASMFGGERIGARRSVVIQDSTRHHAVEPLANIAFLKVRLLGDLAAGRRRIVCHGLGRCDAASRGPEFRPHSAQPAPGRTVR